MQPTQPTSPLPAAHGVSPDEIARFDALADRWWDPDGPMRPLHRMNPLRTAWINARIPPHSRILDIGCGAGLLSESLAKSGHQVTGLDAAPAAIEAARAHAEGQNLPLTYRTGLAEALLPEPARFPVITALEVIEHVPNPAAFVQTLAQLLTPGGHLFLSTLNRTPQSFLVAKLGAEYLLRYLPIGTHIWRQFLTPTELSTHLRQTGLRTTDLTGLTLDPLQGHWKTTRSVAVNYILQATAA